MEFCYRCGDCTAFRRSDWAPFAIIPEVCVPLATFEPFAEEERIVFFFLVIPQESDYR